MQRLKPANEIYKRLKWDKECIPEGDFVVGYEDRFLGILEATLENFEAEEIPFHRIRYFKNLATGQIVWDREKRIDLITSNYSNPHSSDELQGSSSDDISISSTKSKKKYLKLRRKKYLQKTLDEARKQLAEEIRIEEEHVKQYEDRMREVEERLKRFQELQI
ncbi:8927_t:CDS:2 [Diversispora eburnea]|uniref:8927_t:CDS:1 n=1 Tax=Diversispora eburnea TaxID=1213867 RepID=A0A9N9BUP0_9GLOM|nr:8927_t:CDS:2 [Diversispora eburnea]